MPGVLYFVQSAKLCKEIMKTSCGVQNRETDAVKGLKTISHEDIEKELNIFNLQKYR